MVYEDMAKTLRTHAERVTQVDAAEHAATLLQAAAELLEAERVTRVCREGAATCLSYWLGVVDDGRTRADVEQDTAIKRRPSTTKYTRLAYTEAQDAAREVLAQLEGSNEDEGGEAGGAREDAAYESRDVGAARQG